VSKKTFELSVGNKAYKVDVEQFDGKRAKVKVDGKPFDVEVKETGGDVRPPSPGPRPPAPVTPAAKPPAPEPAQIPVRSAASGGEILAPMPGLILDIMVSPGDQVAAGTPVAKIEAMKMENEVVAPADGTVKTIAVNSGDNVSTDDLLMVIE
jgi:biotin carboxyl carrier protein